ncbi:MAG: hypothetical protein JST22_03710 [Bacteroidetes bacterium]|nr:hypothetical protein [Bacteroidota bacterium]
MMPPRLAIMLSLMLFGVAGGMAQGIRVAERFPLGPADSVITLSHEFVVPGSLHLMLDSLPILGTPGELTLDARFGLLRLGPDLRARLRSDSSFVHHLVAEYNYRPLVFPREYYGRKLVVVNDSVAGPRMIAQPPPDLSGSGIFGRNLQRSGSIVRGFTVGTNRDVTVQSGLRLQFSGFVTDDVEVLGALTDEQTPIQPEGNTQTLREVDNIFMEIRAKSADAVLGKFIATNGGSYTGYSRKLQGVKGIVYYGGIGSTEAVVGIAPGRFRTQAIQGQDRNQGPYRLTGENGERNIVLVAGSERVYVDGAIMVRGENNDYVIDYGTGEIFFQTRRPITALSRITVDFEYTERQYSRTFLAVRNNNYFADSTITLSATYLRESDNPDETIDVTLTDADRLLLARVGGDRTRAVRSGVLYVGRSDTVRGSYIRVDTTINGAPDSVFRYAPDDPNAFYNVAFSISPTGIGDYRYVAFGQYEYAGKGLGTYLPVIYLPLPERRQIGAIALTARPAAGVTINAEAAYSDASLNQFSTDPSATLRGGAFNISASARRDTLRIGRTALGSARLGARAEYLGASFEPLERVGEVDFTNRWNAGERPGTGRNENLIVEDTLLWSPVRRLELGAYNGLLRQGGSFHSMRQQYSGRFIGDTLIPGADYTFELITSDTAGIRKTNWLRQRGGADYSLGIVTPAFRFESERREDRAIATGELLPLSYRFVEAGPELRITLPFMVGTMSARYRTEDSARFDTASANALFVHDGATQTYSMSGELRGVRDLSSTVQFTYRRRTYDSVLGADPAGRLNNTTVLARSQTRWNGFNRGLDLDALYEVQTEQAARLQRVFVRVPLGRGDFTWTDLNGDGLQSEDEFRPALLNDGEYVRIDLPTEQLYPVINLRTSTRLRLVPRNVIQPANWLGRLLVPVTTETTLRLEEQSQDRRESDIYLLRFSHFLNDSTTINGTALVQQDVNLFETNPEYSFRFRVQSSYGLQRLVSTIERTENVERSLRVRWQPTFDIGVQLDVAGNRGLLHSTDTTSTRRFDLTGFTVSNDLSYRPTQPLEVGWTLKLMTSRDVLPIVPRTTLLNTNAIRVGYALATQGRLSAELERTNVSGTNIGGDALLLPYQLTNGYAIGTTWTARLGLDYRFGANLQASLNYTGRAQPPSMRAIHIGQAEVRAFF